jgi:vacuolar-type H+-ATPase subunit H
VHDELPMRDVVRMVLDAEGDSKDILEQAVAEAGRIAAEAQHEAHRIVHATRCEMAKEADSIVKLAEQEAEREVQQRLEQAAAEIEGSVHLGDQAIQSAMEAVLRCVCNRA